MVEAARTTASTGAIWAIVIVPTVLLAFWLAAIMIADRVQVLSSGRYGLEDEPEAVPGGALAAGDALAAGTLPGERSAGMPGIVTREPAEAQGRHARQEPTLEGDAPTRADIPAQSRGRHAMPAAPAASSQPDAESESTVPVQSTAANERTAADQPRVPTQSQPAVPGEPVVPRESAVADQSVVGTEPAAPGGPGEGPVAGGQAGAAERSAGRHSMPVQRDGDADRAGRSYAGPAAPDDDEAGRSLPLCLAPRPPGPRPGPRELRRGHCGAPPGRPLGRP